MAHYRVDDRSRRGIFAGMAAGSLVLVTFGLDSIIELASAAVLVWRLSIELRGGQKFSKRTERIAGRLGGASLFLLTAYVTFTAACAVFGREHARNFRGPGFIIALRRYSAVRYLTHRKIAIAGAIGSVLVIRGCGHWQVGETVRSEHDMIMLS